MVPEIEGPLDKVMSPREMSEDASESQYLTPQEEDQIGRYFGLLGQDKVDDGSEI